MPKSRIHLFIRTLRRRQGVLFRALFCWLIALLSLTNDEVISYDRRFQIRGDQAADPKIILIQIDSFDLNRSHPLMKNIDQYSSVPRLDLIENVDTVFWDSQLWRELLGKILVGDPKKIGISLYFDERITRRSLAPGDLEFFQNEKIVWSSVLSEFDQITNSLFTLNDLSNVGHQDLRRDDDGVIRKIPRHVNDALHLVEKLTDRAFPEFPLLSINYRGYSSVFQTVSLSQVLAPDFPADAFKGHYVLIGSKVGRDSQFQTPLGPMSRVEIMAHMADNVLHDRWIQRFNMSVYALILLILVGFAVFIITHYPQTVSLIVFIWLGTLLAALSAWFFDSFYIWFPAITPFMMLVVIWIVFVGYQATKIERQHFRLQQEQKALRELEQLKNNFVSLISHDLKTPLAKIEAIANRLLSLPETLGIRTDLDALKESSDELNRYIQSVLRLLRVESKDFRMNLESSDINELIEQAIFQLAPLAHNKNIQIKTELDPMFLAEFDPILIKEVLINLIDNAIKYTPEGGSVTIFSREISNQIDQFIEVTVQDTGEGISKNEVDQVWNKFVRGREQELKTKGTGLGLYLVKYFVELHGGQVHMRSKLGHGTEVKFSLPLDIAQASQKEEEVEI